MSLGWIFSSIIREKSTYLLLFGLFLTMNSTIIKIAMIMDKPKCPLTLRKRKKVTHYEK